jgi:succinate dehydrogenase / fumarate reductase, cytochrome b subunit
MTTDTRPLSPHLQVYRLPMTAKMSITHRMTGVILMGGMVLFAAFLIAAALGEDAYNLAVSLAASPFGQIALIGWSAAFFYHLCNGVRHLLWDMVFLFKPANAFIAGWIVLIATAVLTGGTWYLIYGGAL